MTEEQLRTIVLVPIAEVHLANHEHIYIHKDKYDLYGMQLYTRSIGIWGEKKEKAWAFNGIWYQDWNEFIEAVKDVEFIEPCADEDVWY